MTSTANRRTLFPALWLLYALFVLYGGTIPFHFAGSHDAIAAKLHGISWNPLVSPETGRRLSIPDAVQNVLLFLPFGAFGYLARRAKQHAVLQIALVVLLGTALSITVEGLQLLTVDRVSSPGDVLCNSAGALAGAVLAWQFMSVGAYALWRLRNEGLAGVPELRAFGIATVVLLTAFWQPFDATLEVGSVVSKVRSLQNDLWQFTGLRDEGTSLMLTGFFAITLASYLSVLGERHAGLKALFGGGALVCSLEASQLFIGSRMPSLWDASVGVAGVALGVVIWSVSARVIWPALWLGVLVVSTFWSAALQMLSPFVISPAYHSFGWFPMLGYYSHTTFETLSHVIELMLLYFPIGFWLGLTNRRPWRALFLALALTAAVAAPVEYLQGWIVGRYPDVTDVGVSLIGAWVGWMAAKTKT